MQRKFSQNSDVFGMFCKLPLPVAAAAISKEIRGMWPGVKRHVKGFSFHVFRSERMLSCCWKSNISQRVGILCKRNLRFQSFSYKIPGHFQDFVGFDEWDSPRPSRIRSCCWSELLVLPIGWDPGRDSIRFQRVLHLRVGTNGPATRLEEHSCQVAIVVGATQTVCVQTFFFPWQCYTVRSDSSSGHGWNEPELLVARMVLTYVISLIAFFFPCCDQLRRLIRLVMQFFWAWSQGTRPPLREWPEWDKHLRYTGIPRHSCECVKSCTSW